MLGRKGDGVRQGKAKTVKPMPRAERRGQLLRTARKIIQRGGIGALTMSALAEESGASKPVVYEHFDNSESVAIALLDIYFATMIDMVDARTSAADTLDEYLSIAIDTQFEFHQKDKLVVRNITNGHSSGERLNAAFLRLKDNSVETLQELLQQQGAPVDASAAAGFVLWEMISSGVYEFADRPDAESAREALKRMVIGAVHAIVPEAGKRPVTPAKILAASRALKSSGDA
jgi:AcrR family transcriptional regulator